MKNAKIEALYKSKYKFDIFYNKVSTLINLNTYLPSTNITPNVSSAQKLVCTPGDLRVDLPVAFGSINADYRLVILGLEPRDSNSKFNIERINKFVYATPFGIEHWNQKNKYYKSFKDLLKKENCYIYFTDVVKEYEVKVSKNEADINARTKFWAKASEQKNLDFLKAEFDIIKPTHIIALGVQTYKFLYTHFGHKVIKLPHPNARQNIKTKENSWDIISRELNKLIM